MAFTCFPAFASIRPDSPPARCRQAQEGTMTIGAKVMSVAAKPTQPSATAARSSEVARCRVSLSASISVTASEPAHAANSVQR